MSMSSRRSAASSSTRCQVLAGRCGQGSSDFTWHQRCASPRVKGTNGVLHPVTRAGFTQGEASRAVTTAFAAARRRTPPRLRVVASSASLRHRFRPWVPRAWFPRAFPGNKIAESAFSSKSNAPSARSCNSKSNAPSARSCLLQFKVKRACGALLPSFRSVK